jgi:PAS domain S-box-containing protein
MKNDYAENLRLKAQALLNQRNPDWNDSTAANVSEILEELEVHRIELQIQNENLQDAYAQLETERAKYANLYHTMPVGYLHLDINGFIQEANQYCCKLLQTPCRTLVGKRLADFIYPQDQPRFHFHLHKLFTEHTPQTDELSITHPDKSVSYIQIISHPIKDTVPPACHILINDITDKKRQIIDQALQETALLLTSSLDVDTVLERILQFVARIVPCDVAFVALWDEEQQSLSLAQMYGLETNTDVRGLSIPLTSTLKSVFEQGEPYLMSYQTAYDGWPDAVDEMLGVAAMRSYVVSPLHIRDELLGFLWVGSRQRQHFTQYHLQDLRMFARQASLAVNNARQSTQSQKLATLSERQRIARELHDAVKQNLFSAALIAANLTKNQQEFSKDSNQYIRYLHESLQAALAEMRILLDELQPDHILDLSDKDMLKKLSKRLSKSGIKISLKTHLDAALPLPIKVTIYRILQEAITNIQTHANAQHVHIKLAQSAAQIELVIEDDGIGFDTSANLDGHGLRNMRQRVDSSNGDINIQSQVGKGTHIAVSWRLATTV